MAIEWVSGGRNTTIRNNNTITKITDSTGKNISSTKKSNSSIRKPVNDVKQVSKESTAGELINYIDLASSSKSSITTLRTQTPQQTSSKNWYSQLDQFFGGYLPGGLSTTEAKANSLRKKTDETKILADTTINYTEANKVLQEAELRNKNIEDFYDKSFLESLGIGYSQEEKTLQTAIQRGDFFQEQATQLRNTNDQIQLLNTARELYPEAEKSLIAPLTDYGAVSTSIWDKVKNPLMIGGIVIGAVLLLPSLMKTIRGK
jgi:hypothetical protein